MLIISRLSLIILFSISFLVNKASNICFGDSYTQPPNSMCFSFCSSPPSGQTWTITYSGSYTITTPSSIAGTYSGNQTLITTTSPSEFCSNISITFNSGPSTATVASSNGTCGSRSETHTITGVPSSPSGGLLIHNVNAGNCIDLTAQGRICSLGAVTWCVNSGIGTPCIDIVTPSNYCPDSSKVVYAYCYNASAGVNCRASSYEKDSIDVSGTTSTFEVISNSVLTLYPNPTQEILFIETSKGNTYIEVFNVQGKLLLSKLLNSSKTSIEVNGFLPGLYLIKSTDRNGVIQNKTFVKE